MNDYHVSNSKNIFCEDLGLDWLKRASVLAVEKAQPIEWHAHNTIEILFCLKGVLVYEFAAGPSVTIKPGQFIVIAPFARHRLSGGVDGPSKRGSIFIARRLPLDCPDRFPSREHHHQLVRALLAAPHCARSIPKPDLPTIRALYEMIDHRAQAPRSGESANGVTSFDFLSTLLFSLSVFSRQTPALQTADDDVIPQCAEHLIANLARSDAIATTVAYSGYSRSRFFQLFRQHTGKTPLEYLTEVRVAAVKTRLADPSCSIADAARSCGFGDLDFFRQVFRRQTGQSPSAYRANLEVSPERVLLRRR